MATLSVTPCCWQLCYRRLCCRADGGGVSGVAPAAGRRAAGSGAAPLVSSQVRLGFSYHRPPLRSGMRRALEHLQCPCVLSAVGCMLLLLAAGMPRCRSVRSGTGLQPSTMRFAVSGSLSCIVSPLRPDMKFVVARLPRAAACAPMLLTWASATGPSSGGGGQQLWPAAAAADTQAGSCTGLHLAAACLHTRFALLSAASCCFLTAVMCVRYLQQQGVPLSSAQVLILGS